MGWTDRSALVFRRRAPCVQAHDAWLACAAAELILEPDMPVVDAHHHLWDKNPDPGRRHMAKYMLEELVADIDRGGHNVVKTVYMQSGSAGWRREAGRSTLHLHACATVTARARMTSAARP